MDKIEIFKPFEQSIELMKKILFEPFDLKKWLAIGFTAFLANLGAGFNFRFNNFDRKTTNWHDVPGWQEVNDWIGSIPHWLLILCIVFVIALVLVLTVVFMWLRSRGVFMFTDCVVKNRAAIAQPWREFHREGNSFFLFQLLVVLVFLLLGGVLALPFLLPVIRGVAFLHLHDVYLISVFVAWAAVMLVITIAWAVIGQLMIIIMYRRRCRAMEAFRAALSLINHYPGEIVLYCLFWIVLGLATVVVACLATCLTCCVTALPYIGTVVLLPIYVTLRGFALLFVRQFGPDYDAWGGGPPVPPPPLPAVPA